MPKTSRLPVVPPVTTTVFTPRHPGLQVKRRYIGDRDAARVVADLLRCHNE